MKFDFDIDLDKYLEEEYCSKSFKEIIAENAINAIAENFYNREVMDSYRSIISQQVSELIKSKEKEICEAIIDRVSDKIIHKKVIFNMMPKASELASIDKSNLEYFESLINKAIAKKFK